MEIEWKIDMSCAKNSQSENASFGQGSGKNWQVVVIFVVREKSDLAGLLHYLRLLSFFGTEIDSFTGYSVIPQILFKKVLFFSTHILILLLKLLSFVLSKIEF